MNSESHLSPSIYVGLDVHKDSIDVAVDETGRADVPADVCAPVESERPASREVDEAGRDGEVRHLGTVAGGQDAVTKTLRPLVSAGHRLHTVNEAGP